MSAKQMYWMPDERNLIEAIKGYPEIYKINALNPGKSRIVVNNLYAKIGEFLMMNPRIIKKNWYEIYINYSRIRSLIKKNATIEDYLKDHPLTKKYLDGTLSFLDKYVPLMDGVILSDVLPVLNNKKSDDTADNPKYANETVVDIFMIKAMILIREKKETAPNLDNIDIEFIKKALMDANLSKDVAESSNKLFLSNLASISNTGAKHSKRMNVVSNGNNVEDVTPENVLIPHNTNNKNQSAPPDYANNPETERINMRGFFTKVGDIAEALTEDKKKLLMSKINAIIFEITQNKIL